MTFVGERRRKIKIVALRAFHTGIYECNVIKWLSMLWRSRMKMKGISWGNEKEFNIQRNDFCGKYAVRHVFWAGNLIFPASMGQMAGNQMGRQSPDSFITGVGLPLLGVVALGVSRKNGLLEVSSQVGRHYGIFFTSMLYLTIGPSFAIPRCATVAFSVVLSR